MSESSQHHIEYEDLGSLAKESEKIRLKETEEKNQNFPTKASNVLPDTSLIVPAQAGTDEVSPQKYKRLPSGVFLTIILISLCINGASLDFFRASVLSAEAVAFEPFMSSQSYLLVLKDQMDAISPGNPHGDSLYLSFVERLTRRFGDSDQRVSFAKLGLAYRYLKEGKTLEARSLWQSVIPNLEKPTSESPREITTVLWKLGVWYDDRQDYQSALPFYQAVVRFYPFAPTSEASLSGAETFLASTYLNLRDFKNANEYFLKAYTYGKRYGRIAQNAYRLLGIVRTYNLLGKYEEADRFSKDAVELAEEVYQPNSCDIAYILAEQGIAKLGLGKYADAISPLEKSAQILQPTWPDYNNYIFVEYNLAKSYAALGQLDKASPLLLDVLQKVKNGFTGLNRAEVEKICSSVQKGLDKRMKEIQKD